MMSLGSPRPMAHGAPDPIRSLRAEIDSYDRTIRDVEFELQSARGPRRLELNHRRQALMLALDRRRHQLEQLLSPA